MPLNISTRVYSILLIGLLNFHLFALVATDLLNPNLHLDQNTQVISQDLSELSGQVVASGTGTLLKKAYLQLRNLDSRKRQSYSARTDTDGKYEIKGVVPGRYRLICERDGYLKQEYKQFKPG